MDRVKEIDGQSEGDRWTEGRRKMDRVEEKREKEKKERSG